MNKTLILFFFTLPFITLEATKGPHHFQHNKPFPTQAQINKIKTRKEERNADRVAPYDKQKGKQMGTRKK